MLSFSKFSMVWIFGERVNLKCPFNNPSNASTHNTVMVSQVTLSHHDMTCHLVKVFNLLLDTVLFPVSSYPTQCEGPK